MQTDPIPTTLIAEPFSPRFTSGVLGAITGGFIGMLAWFLLIKFTGYEIGYAAWGVGVLTGFAAAKLAGGGNSKLGFIAAACAFIAIIGGQYLVVKEGFDGFVEQALAGAYDNQMQFAKDALAAQSDDEIKSLLAKEDAEDGAAPAPDKITATDIQEFKTERLPKLRDLASGKITQAQFESQVRGTLNAPAMKLQVLKSSVGLFTLLWLFLGVGSAYRIASGNTD